MVELGQTLTILNIVIAVGVILSTIISLFRGGWVRRFIDSIDKIDSIDEKVDDLHDWKDGADDVMVAISKAEDGVDATAAKKRLGVDTGYAELLDEDESLEDHEQGHTDETGADDD